MARPRFRVDCHSWIIAVNTCVVDLIGLHPYCLWSNDGSNTHWSQCPIKDSRTWLLLEAKRLVWDHFGWTVGEVSWYCNNLGRLPDWRDKPLPNRCVKTAANGSHRYGAKSSRNQFGKLSGPGALKIFIVARRFATSTGSVMKSKQSLLRSAKMRESLGRCLDTLTKKSLISSASLSGVLSKWKLVSGLVCLRF